MTTCRCGSDTHRDFPDKTERCSGCDRTPAWCRCERSDAKRVPLWLARARQRPHGLSRDLSGVA